MPHQVLRIIDASMNRIGEGLRLLEDVARLLLDDAALTEQLKVMRHDLLRGDLAFQQQLVKSRDATGDVGIDIEVAGDDRERDLPMAVVANARRVQESLRTLEELAKVPETSGQLDSERFKHARFRLYTLEQELLSRLARREKIERVRGLYVIIDSEFLGERSHVEVAGQALRGGASTIQLRDKTTGKGELLAVARELRALCERNGALFIMNDYLDLALAVRADGLHLGQKDLPLAEARKLLPMDMMLGCSVTSVDLAVAAESDGADYIAVGSMYPTASKATAVVVGPDMLRNVRQAASCPLVAIGGISRDNVADVVAAGADSVAVIRAVVSADDPEEAARQIVEKMEVNSGQADT